MALALPRPAPAHPHSFLDASVSVAVVEGRIVALEVTWLFDEADTETAIFGNDKDGDGKLDAAELATLAGRMHRVIAQQHYHTHLRVDGKPVPLAGIDGLTLDLMDGRLRARFRAALAAPVDPRRQKAIVGLYDDSYYIQFGFDPARDFRVDGALPAGCKLETYVDRETTLYEFVGSKVHATVTEIRCDP